MTFKHITKGSINRLGDTIRSESEPLKKETLDELQEYRISHKDSINKVFNSLCSLSKKVRKDAIVTYRLKRIESIIGKIYRLPDQKFSRMGDIAGCRCILNSDSEVRKLEKLIYDKFDVKKRNDYLEKPKSNGYKSLHLYLNLPNDNKTIEVQIRNSNDHNWATLVEITDLLFDSQLKEFGKDQNLEKFHLLLSDKSKLNYKEKQYIAKTLRDYDYFGKISTVFAKNYLEVRKRWMQLESKPNHKFFLIETKKDAVPIIDSFRHFNLAENEYFSRYLEKRESNIVLTHLTKPTYKNISSAYSNYMLTVHSILDDIKVILESLIIQSLKSKRYYSYLKYYNLYWNILIKNLNNFNSEILYSNNVKNGDNKRPSFKTSKEIEWEFDIQRQKDDILNRLRILQRELNRLAPRFFLTNLTLIIATRIIKSSNKKLLKEY